MNSCMASAVYDLYIKKKLNFLQKKKYFHQNLHLFYFFFLLFFSAVINKALNNIYQQQYSLNICIRLKILWYL